MTDSTSQFSLDSQQSSHDHKLCIKKAMQMAEKLCQERGAQLTPIRQKILELIWENHQAVKAYDLLEKIKPFNFSAKPATVYRALDFLIEQRLIHRVESLNAFIGCNHMESKHDLLLLICDQCNQIEEKPAPQIMASLTEELKKTHFIVRSKSIEIHGICARCQLLSKQN